MAVSCRARHRHGQRWVAACWVEALGSGPVDWPLPALAPPSQPFVAASRLPCQRLTDTSLFSLPTVAEATVLRSLRGVSAGVSRWATTGGLTSCRLLVCSPSADQICHLRVWERGVPSLFLMVFFYITLRFSPNFLLFRLLLEWACQSDVCLSPNLPRKPSSLSLAAL